MTSKIIVKNLLEQVGNTPCLAMDIEDMPGINLYAKLELCNPTGSVKDRAASYILGELVEKKKISPRTTIIESSSGNFGVALAAYCQKYDLRFICVVDPHISPCNEMLIQTFGAEVIKVDQPDEYGGYLLTRIQKVKELAKKIDDSYWVNQYGNPLNARAYYHTLGEEICRTVENIDYIFLGISSGGTITGVSNKLKERFPQVRVIAVDIVGSVIFGHPPQKRYIPGIGSSMVPEILERAKIDDVVMINEVTTIDMCHRLLERYHVFAGGSSGSAFGAIREYFGDRPPGKKINVVTVFPDRGERYVNTIYNKEWCRDFVRDHARKKELDGNVCSAASAVSPAAGRV